jgi:hypothetical protein
MVHMMQQQCCCTCKTNVQIGHIIKENEKSCPTGKVARLTMGRGKVIMPSPWAMSWICCTKPPTHTLVLATLWSKCWNFSFDFSNSSIVFARSFSPSSKQMVKRFVANRWHNILCSSSHNAIVDLTNENFAPSTMVWHKPGSFAEHASFSYPGRLVVRNVAFAVIALFIVL